MLLRETDINTIEFKKGQIWQAAVSYTDKNENLVEKFRPILIWGPDNVVIPHDVPCMVITTNLESPGIKINMRDIFSRRNKIISACIRCDKILYIRPSLIMKYVTSIPDEILSHVNTLCGLYNGFIDISTAPEWAIHIIQKYNTAYIDYQDTLKRNNSDRFTKYNGIMYDINKIENIQNLDTNISKPEPVKPIELPSTINQEQLIVPEEPPSEYSSVKEVIPEKKKHDYVIPGLRSMVMNVKEKQYLDYDEICQEVIRFILDDTVSNIMKKKVFNFSLATFYRIKKYAKEIFRKDGGLQHFAELPMPKSPFIIDDINSLNENEKKSVMIMTSSEKTFDKFYKIGTHDIKFVKDSIMSTL